MSGNEKCGKLVLHLKIEYKLMELCPFELEGSKFFGSCHFKSTGNGSGVVPFSISSANSVFPLKL